MPLTLPAVIASRRAVGATVLNFATYSGWTLINKKLFTVPEAARGTVSSAPLLCTTFQMMVAACLAYLLVVRLGVQRSPQVNLLDARVWRSRILPLGLSRAVDIGCGNVALALVTVALQQVVKATLPVFVTVLSVVVLRKRVSMQMMLSLVPVVFGTIMASVSNGGASATSSAAGVVLALVSCFGRASKAVLNALLLAGGTPAGSKLQPLEIVLLEVPTTGAIMLIPALMFEGSAVLAGTSLLQLQPMYMLLSNVACGGLMLLTQAAYVTLIDETSALSCQILMSIKMLLLVFFSVWWLGTPFTTWNAIGVLLAGVGCVWYAQSSKALNAADLSKKRDDGPTQHV